MQHCEILSEISIDNMHYKVTLSPVAENFCILWYKDDRISNSFEALGKFSHFDKARVLEFVVRFTTNPRLRTLIEEKTFERRIDRISPRIFDQMQKLSHQEKLKAYRDLFDLDYIIEKDELARKRRIMAKRFHPDAGGSGKAMAVINEAYDILLNESENKRGIR
jgi:hypothetical protein